MISDKKEIKPDTRIVTRKMVTTHRIVFLLSFFAIAGSDLDTGIIPFSFNKDGSRQDKSYGLGRVVFHREEPAVAAQAVSVYSPSPAVAKSGYPIATETVL